MQTIKDATTEFLAKKRIAVTGVSRNPKGHGSNAVYQRLRARGYEVFAINPNADEVEGDRCYHDLQSVPDGVEAVVIGTRPETADTTMREMCRTRNPTRVDASRTRARERVGKCSRLRQRARHQRDRRWLPAHV